jgi:hypothetical protein
MKPIDVRRRPSHQARQREAQGRLALLEARSTARRGSGVLGHDPAHEAAVVGGDGR